MYDLLFKGLKAYPSMAVSARGHGGQRAPRHATMVSDDACVPAQILLLQMAAKIAVGWVQVLREKYAKTRNVQVSTIFFRTFCYLRRLFCLS